MARVLKPGGKAYFSLSNRRFPTKVIDIWNTTNDVEHAFLIGSFFHYSGGFQAPSAVEISPNKDRFPIVFGNSTNNAYLTVVEA